MSVIGVKGFPFRTDLRTAIKTVGSTIGGNFEALNFYAKGNTSIKTCYFRLSDRLDPVRVVEKINSSSFKKMNLHAFIPEKVPDLPLATKSNKLTMKLRRTLKISEEYPPKEVFTIAHKEIMTELQARYPRLYSLSQKSNHQLLEQIAWKIFERLKGILERGADPCEFPFALTACYRRTHPHFGDFQLVLSTMHELEDAAGAPRTQITEADLGATSNNAYTTANMPHEEVVKVCNKYSDRVSNKLNVHIQNLDCKMTANDSEETIARKKVRQELKNMGPYLPMIIKQVIQKHILPERIPSHKIRIYGEPFLPNKEQMGPFVRRLGGLHVVRSQHMYNLLLFNVPPSKAAAVRAMDGTLVSTAKLVIRSSGMPLHKESEELSEAIARFFNDSTAGRSV